MNKSEPEIWKAHPEYAGIEVSTLGRVRTIDRVVSGEKGTRSLKGRVLKQQLKPDGYLQVGFRVNGKSVTKSVHRLVAETFIPNPNNFPQVNHLDCDRANNNIDNLEWCNASYNIQYREKYGESLGVPVLAINLTTLEVLRFNSQNEASRVLGVLVSNINAVIKGTQKAAHGFWFVRDDGNGIEIDKDKLNDIVDGMRFRGGVFAVNLTTLEVSRFHSQNEASRVLGVLVSNINAVIKGTQKAAHGFWFVRDDGNGIEIDKDKLNDIVDGMRFRGGVFAVNLTTLEVSRFHSQNEAGRALGVSNGNINEVIKGKRKQANGFWFVRDDGHKDAQSVRDYSDQAVKSVGAQ